MNPTNTSSQASCCTPVSPAEVAPGCCSAGATTPTAEASSYSVFRIGLSLAIAGQGMLVGLGYNVALEAGEAPVYGTPAYWGIHGGLLLSAALVIGLLGRPLWLRTLASVKQRRLTVEGLFLLSALGALGGSLISSLAGEGSVYYEVVAVVLSIYAIGQAIGARSRQSVLAEVNRLRESFTTAWVYREGQRVRVPLDDLCPCSSRVSVMPGEPISVNGTLVEGTGYVSEVSLTGEPAPQVKQVGDTVQAGSYSVDGTFLIQPDLDSPRLIDGILDTVEQARQRPSRLQEQADRLMQWFLPIVVAVSALTFAVWLFIPGTPWWSALFNSMAVLLVACPCALGLATPMAVWGGLNRLSQLGLVARSGRFIDELARADTVLFDKTGTLSEDSLKETDFLIHADRDGKAPYLPSVVSAIEEGLPHPVAKAIRYPSEGIQVAERRLVPGLGVEAVVDGVPYRIGEKQWMPQQLEADFDRILNGVTAKKTVYVAEGEKAAGVILLDEAIRDSTYEAIAQLIEMGLHCEILTGDPRPSLLNIAGAEVKAGLKPEDKTARMDALQAEGRQALFVGDGLNDAGALASAQASIAMSSGAELSRGAADATLLGGNLNALPKAIQLSRRIHRSLYGNMQFAVLYNGFGMSLAALGILHPVVAALLMAGSSALVSARALRAVS